MSFASVLTLLRDRWHQLFHVYRALDRDSAQVRARLVATVVRLTPLVALANLANAVLVAVAIAAQVAPAWLAAWVLALAGCSVPGLRSWWRHRASPVKAASPRAVRKATAGAAVLAAVWAVPALFWFPGAGHGEQMLIAGVMLGTICGGAFLLAPLPTAALVFIGTLAAACHWALWHTAGPTIQMLHGVLLMYMLVMATATLATAQIFTARLVSEREAARQGQLVALLLRDFEEHSADVLWEVGPAGFLTHVSHRLSAALGSTEAELHAVTLLQALQRRSRASDGEGHLEALRSALTAGQAFRDLVVPVRAAGGLRWWSLTAKPLLDEAGHHGGWRGVITDVTQARETHRRLAYLAHFDSLTGLANRLELRERLAAALKPRSGATPRVGLMCLDVDHFKSINDSFGHAAGDAVLVEVGRRMQASVRPGDLAARLGGDEFALMVVDVQDLQELQDLAARLVHLLCEPCEIDGRQMPMGVSVGVALAPEHGRTLDELMASADLALYAAKEGGRRRHEVFMPRLGDRHRRRVAIDAALRGVMQRAEMHLHWQPRVDVQTWQVVGAEVLLRWHHPELGRVGPDEFIRVAEESGQIAEIGAWVMGRACMHAAQMPQPISVSVNVSPVQLMRDDFEAAVRRALHHSGLEPRRLEIEVTESLFIDASAQALANLHALREMGVRIALDDFGTGYSSLAYLRRFPFDTLKIDRAFVLELMTRHDARAIVKTIIDLARTLGMSTIAEGVEEPAQLQLLRDAGCEAIQGFMVARPMPRGELIRLLASWGPSNTVFSEPLPPRPETGVHSWPMPLQDAVRRLA